MKKTKESLTAYEIIPEDMKAYLANYGRHFNKAMYEFAVSNMYKENKEKIKPISKEEFKSKLASFNVTLDNDTLYDGMFVYCMCKADFLGKSIIDEYHQLLYVKDVIDDVDQADGYIFNRFYADCMLKGTPIDWSDMI